MGASCNHIEHVRTQIFYALFVACVAIFIGYIPAGLGVPWYISLGAGVIVMFVGLRVLGEKVGFDEVEEASS